MSLIDEEELIQLTKLCRIECTKKERETLLKNLSSILDYIDQLQEVDTEGVPTCNHVLETVHNVFREDRVQDSLDRETFLKNSPSHVGGMIRVPPVMKF